MRLSHNIGQQGSHLTPPCVYYFLEKLEIFLHIWLLDRHCLSQLFTLMSLFFVWCCGQYDWVILIRILDYGTLTKIFISWARLQLWSRPSWEKICLVRLWFDTLVPWKHTRISWSLYCHEAKIIWIVDKFVTKFLIYKLFTLQH